MTHTNDDELEKILAEYEIGFVTHGKDIDEHLAKFKAEINKHYIKRSELYKDPRYLALKVQIGQLEAELAPYRAFRAAIKESE